MSTFVTGGTGLVGAYLLHYLVRRGERVRALRRRNSPMLLVDGIASRIEWVEADLNDRHALEEVLSGVEFVYHSAAMVSFKPADAQAMFRINIEGTANLVNACLDKDVRKYVQVSSVAALGRKSGQGIIDEQSPWENAKGNSNYAISKFKSECEVWRAMEEGLNAVIINPSMILGAGYWDVGTNNFFQQIYKGFGYYPAGTAGFVDVRDVARAAIALMDSAISGERFVVSAENWSYRDFTHSLARHLGVKPPSRALSPFMAGLAWRLDALRATLTGKPPRLTREILQSVQSEYRYDNSKIQKAIDFRFAPIENCIAQTAPLFLKGMKEGSRAALLDLDA